MTAPVIFLGGEAAGLRCVAERFHELSESRDEGFKKGQMLPATLHEEYLYRAVQIAKMVAHATVPPAPVSPGPDGGSRLVRMGA